MIGQVISGCQVRSG